MSTLAPAKTLEIPSDPAEKDNLLLRMHERIQTLSQQLDYPALRVSYNFRLSRLKTLFVFVMDLKGAYT